MKKAYIWILLIIVVVAAALWWFTRNDMPMPETGNSTNESRYMDIESFVRSSISDLSPIKAQLGGTFYVTAIQTLDGVGTVSYEDGHDAYTADFTYTVDTEGRPSVDSFTIREDR